MKFLGKYPNSSTLTEFSTLHITALAFIAAAIILTLIFGKKISKWEREKKLRYAITFVAIALELTYKIWYGVTDQGRLIADYLSLDLCALSLYMGWILMLTNKKWIFKLLYFFSIGALFSLFLPDISFGYDHFRYYHYFFSHGFIIWVPIYYIAVHGETIRFKDAIRAFMVLFPVSMLVMGLDFLIDANYMFLHHKPDMWTPLDWFGPWPQYIVGLVGLALVLFIIWYLPWLFINLYRKHKENNRKIIT